MSMDTNAWKQLLEGTEPGPWRASLLSDGIEHEDGSSNYRGGIYPEGQGSPPILITNGMDKQNARLIAAAPAAVAEVVRLRRELEELKRKVGSLTLSAELLAGDHPKHAEALCLAADEFRTLHDTITNIIDQEEK